MIQPLKSTRALWTVVWIDLDEPVPTGTDFFLPTLLIVTNQSGTPVASPEILEELDQPRIESILGALIDRLGAPDRIIIGDSEEWDDAAWDDFAEDYKVDIQFSKIATRDSDDVTALTKQFVATYKIGPDPARERPSELATGLVNTALRIRSETKRIALLKKALASDAECSAARIELADAEFRRADWNRALRSYDDLISREFSNWDGRNPAWWTDRATRPYLRAIFGRAMTLWHQGRHLGAAETLSDLLEMNPVDHQGARFLVPLVYLLAEDYESADACYAAYQSRYPGDYAEPAFLFGWGVIHAYFGRDSEAVDAFCKGILKNIYVASLVLDLPSPPWQLWHPNDRADPNYAREFLDSYAVLWERVPAASRALREAFERQSPRLQQIIAHRAEMLDLQDQRYEPNYKATWQARLEQEERLTCSPSAS